MFVTGHATFIKKGKKIDNNYNLVDCELKKLQQSVFFWRFLSSNGYPSSLSSSKNIIFKDWTPKKCFPLGITKINDISFATKKILEKLKSDSKLSNKIILTDSIEHAFQIKHLLKDSKSGLGVLPEIHLISDFENYQSKRPINKNPVRLLTDDQRLLLISKKIPNLSSYARMMSMSSLELASQWLNVIQRWEWMQESWEILGSPANQTNFEKFSLNSFQYLFNLKQALQDESNAARWHKTQFKLSFETTESKRRKNVNPYSAVIMILTEYPDPLLLAKSLILARKKPSSWNIFLYEHPISIVNKTPHNRELMWDSWQENFKHIWPEVYGENSQNFELRRKKVVENTNNLVKRWSTPEPFICFEANSLERLTEAVIGRIRYLSQEGINSLGIVPLDRRATRRLLAKLKNQKIDVNDHAGWSLDTSVVSLSLLNLVKVTSGIIYRDDLFHWLNNPVVKKSLKTVGILDDRLLTELNDKLKFTQEETNVYSLLPKNLLKKLKILKDNKICKNLIYALEITGIGDILAKDSAGREILKICKAIEINLSSDDIQPKDLIELIELRFSQLNFSLESVKSNIRLINFRQAFWDPPEALIVIGATRDRLPGINIPKFADSLFWEKAAANLSNEQKETIYIKHFINILNLKIPVSFFAQLSEEKKNVLWARWIERVRLMLSEKLHKKIFVKVNPAIEQKNKVDFDIKMPSISLSSFPKRLFVTDIKSLLECPYKFFWQSIIGVRQETNFFENDNFKDIGQCLHLLMERVEHEISKLNESKKITLDEESWKIIFMKILQGFQKENYSLEVILNLTGRINQLSKWCCSYFENKKNLRIEQKFSAKLPLSSLQVVGKVDRVDHEILDKNQNILIDYKSSKISNPDKESKFLQILLYTWLLRIDGVKITNAGYVEITSSSCKWIPATLEKNVELTVDKLDQTIDQLKNGQRIKPIAGMTGHVCKRCAAKSICRKDEWKKNL